MCRGPRAALFNLRFHLFERIVACLARFHGRRCVLNFLYFADRKLAAHGAQGVAALEAKQAANIEIGRRERNADAVAAQCIVQCPGIGGLDRARPLGRLRRQPYDQLEIEATLRKLHEPYLWLAPFHSGQRESHFRSSLKCGFFHKIFVDAVVDAEWHVEPDHVVTQSPVHDAAGDELGIGHQDVDVVVRHDARGTDADVAYFAADARFELDEIANLQAAIEEQYQSRHEIAEDRLQAETETDADRTSQHSKLRQRNPHESGRDQHADYDQYVLGEA